MVTIARARRTRRPKQRDPQAGKPDVGEYPRLRQFLTHSTGSGSTLSPSTLLGAMSQSNGRFRPMSRTVEGLTRRYPHFFTTYVDSAKARRIL